jgi:hypothetical protein
MKRHQLVLAAALAAILGPAAPAAAQTPPAAPPGAQTVDLQATIAKFNAYVGFLNRSQRAQEALERYASWVNMQTGPTGHEHIIYGLYAPFDTTKEAAAASAALTQPPLMPDLDNAMRDYIAANAALSPILTEADSYYDRKDYMADGMAGGKALHARIVPAAKAYTEARSRVDALFAIEKAKVDTLELAAIEAREGRDANWQVKNVMIDARNVVDLLPTNAKPVVDLPQFDTALNAYAAAVKDMDTYGAAHPNSFFVFESQPRTLLGKLRDFREAVGRAKGDARRGGGDQIMWIVNDYNTMITTSQHATQFAK